VKSRLLNRHGFTITEMAIGAGILSLIFLIVFWSLIHGVKTTNQETARMSIVRGVVALRTLMMRDLINLGSDILVETPVPGHLILRSAADAPAREIHYFSVDFGHKRGTIYRRENSDLKRIGLNFTGTFRVDVDATVGEITVEVQSLDPVHNEPTLGAPVIHATFSTRNELVNSPLAGKFRPVIEGPWL